MFAHKLAVIGTGLIGGSIGLAARAATPEVEVVGFDDSTAAVEIALERGAVTHSTSDIAAAVADADLVVVAVPVDLVPATCEAIAPVLPPETVVTDVGSAKREVVTAAERTIGRRFVGGHPMAGSERHGIEAADAALFEGAYWILTPTSATASAAYQLVTSLVTSVGAKPVAIDPTTHDSLVARLSHLPQLAASVLVDVAVGAGTRESLLGLAAGGFRDVTRIAASSPDLWVAILRSNQAAVLEAITGFEGRLDELSSLMRAGRWDELRSFLDRARTARLELFAKPDYGGEPVALSFLVPDRPGVLAEVTTAAGRHGVNIEDLRIVHSTEGGRGRLELIVAREAAAPFGRALETLGYRVEQQEIE